jgi:hypothetical protein
MFLFWKMSLLHSSSGLMTCESFARFRQVVSMMLLPECRSARTFFHAVSNRPVTGLLEECCFVCSMSEVLYSGSHVRLIFDQEKLKFVQDRYILCP